MKTLVNKSLIASLCLTSTLSLANSGVDLLMQKTGSTKVGTQTSFKATKQLELDDAFLVQLYGTFRELGTTSFEVNTWVNTILSKDYEKAAHLITVMQEKAPEKFRPMIDATALYLYWRLDLPQTFFNAWMKLSSEGQFLNSTLGVALDEVVAQESSQWFIDKGIIISADQKIQLKQIENISSKFNFSAQAWNALRTGNAALSWMKKLAPKDPLRFYLAQTIVVDLAKQGRLADAAGLLKEVHEPKANETEQTEEIVDYYMLLARLLYQAGALEASTHYYSLIPDESKKYLQAKIENLWIELRNGDMAKIKGDLASLELSLFKDKFLPEIYLVSSIANLKLCQFTNVKNAFDQFISNNKEWSKKIDKNIAAENPAEIDATDFYLSTVTKALNNLSAEKIKLSELAKKSVEATVPAVGEQAHWKKALVQNNRTHTMGMKTKTYELRKRWGNRKKVLEASIRKMRFVKIEFISLMRKINKQLAKAGTKHSDSVTSYSAATKKRNEVEFPFDGVLFSDEVFSMRAEVKSLCLSGVK
jgi:hypothetical protein